MAETTAMLFQLGAVLLVAFIGAALASRLRLSVIIGYVLAGILIGPFVRFDLFGWSYTGLVTDTAFIEDLSQIGIVLLLFFVGLGFSATRLRRTKEAAIILAVVNLGVNLFGGFVLGAYLGWPLIDTIFLAGVVSMSSSAITAKSLLDLKRLSNAETEFILGMVILESFLAMFLLTVVNGMVVRTTVDAPSLPFLFGGILLFIGFFAFLAAFAIPRGAAAFERIKSDELFILFALGLVFLAAALAEMLRIPAIIGGFFLGMAFADTKLTERFAEKMSSLRDAFVAVFFVSFGMMIDPNLFPNVAWMILIAVPLIILNDIFLTAVLAYFIGFSSRAAVSIGTSLIGRNEEAILYASVGTRAIQSNPALSNDYGGAHLNPFAGILCVVMSSLAPMTMKRSHQMAAFFERRLPAFLAFGGDLVKRTLKTFVLPAFLPLYSKDRRLQGLLIAFSAYVVVLTLSDGPVHLVASGALPGLLYVCWFYLHRAFAEPVKHTNYGISTGSYARVAIENFVVRIVLGALAAIAIVAAVWQYWWPASLFALLGYLVVAVWSMRAIHRELAMGKSPRLVVKPRRWAATSHRIWGNGRA